MAERLLRASIIIIGDELLGGFVVRVTVDDAEMGDEIIVPGGCQVREPADGGQYAYVVGIEPGQQLKQAPAGKG